MQTYAVEVQIHNSLKSTQFMNIEVLFILKYFRLKSLINVSPANIEPLSFDWIKVFFPASQTPSAFTKKCSTREHQSAATDIVCAAAADPRRRLGNLTTADPLLSSEKLRLSFFSSFSFSSSPPEAAFPDFIFRHHSSLGQCVGKSYS